MTDSTKTIILEDVPATELPIIKTIPYAGILKPFRGFSSCPADDRIHISLRARIGRGVTDTLKHPSLLPLRQLALMLLPLPHVKIYDPQRGTYYFAVIDAAMVRQDGNEWWAYRGYRIDIKKFDGLPDIWVMQPKPITVNWFYDARKFWIVTEK